MESLKDMLQKVNEPSKKIVLQMNLHKTKIMRKTWSEITIDNVPLENISEYTYLGHTIGIGKENQTAEIKRNIQL